MIHVCKFISARMHGTLLRPFRSITGGSRRRMDVRSTAQRVDVDGMLTKYPWLLTCPSARITAHGRMLVVRDDLQHGLWGGNKARKLDAMIPVLVADGVTDVVTCGGLQSAHASAVPAALAHAGLAAGQLVRTHLLLRGERPPVLTGHLLMAAMHATTIQYVRRSEYADRAAMLQRRVAEVQAANPAAKVAVVEEGAQSDLALLGLVRLVHWLGTSAQGLPDPYHKRYQLVVDSGTGTTAVGVAIGVWLMGLPWRVTGVMLAGDESYYRQQQTKLHSEFHAKILDAAADNIDSSSGVSSGDKADAMLTASTEQLRPQTCGPAQQHASGGHRVQPASLPLDWVPRIRPRKFGKLLDGDLALCKQVAQEHGVLLDPIWTLAAWEVVQAMQSEDRGNPAVPVMLHTGGSVLALQGLSQRYPDLF